MKHKFTHFLISLALILSAGPALSQKSTTGDIWLHMLSFGEPIETRFLGDRLSEGSTYFINFEIGQASWYQSDAGIGLNNSDPAEWSWRSATWYEDGENSNKKVRSDFADFQFTQIGAWYFNGRARAEAGDPWHYTNGVDWGNSASFAPVFYFQVENINEVSMVTTFQNAGSPASAIDINWVKNQQLNDVMIIRKRAIHEWGSEPVQGTAYSAGDSIGNGVVIYTGSDTVFTDTGLTAATLYSYKVLAVNNDYYSPVGSVSVAYTTYEQGDGSEGNPYQISTAEGLNLIRYYTMIPGQSNFIQTADIDLTAYSPGTGWVPLDALRESYNGQGHMISNLTINDPSCSMAGLFGSIQNGGSIRNLGLVNVNIKAGSTAGALVGQVNYSEAANGIKIESCYSTGTVEIVAGGTGAWNVGGLVGTMGSGMNKCYSTCDIIVNNSNTHQYVGGLVGALISDTIRNSYFHGTIDCNTSSYYQEIGGLAGSNTGTILNSYAASPMSYFPTEFYNWIGGIAGRETYTGNTSNSFFDLELAGGSGFMFQQGAKTTTEMKQLETYTDAGWDFSPSGLWAMNSFTNDGYPVLNYQPLTTAIQWVGTTSSDWTDASNWSGDAVPQAGSSVVISVTGHDPVIDGAVQLTNLVIEGGVLTIGSAGQFTVTGFLSNEASSSNLVIESGGSFICSSTGINGTVKRNIPANEWHLISSPVSDATAGIFQSYYLQMHDEPSNTYMDITSISDSLIPVKGYAHFGDAGFPVASFAGHLNSGSFGYQTSYSGTGKGWNLVGNPYPSAIDWDAASGLTRTNLNDAVYIHRDAETWATYIDGVGTNGGSSFIAPCQGFFVESTDAGELSMTDDARVHHMTTFYKNGATVANLVRLAITGNGYQDEAVVRFKPEASDQFDGKYDAHKLFGGVPAAAQIYTLGSGKLSINTLPETNHVQVGISAGNSGYYTIAATEITDLSYVTLEDTRTGNFTNLKTSSYSFLMEGGISEQRFKLHFDALGEAELEVKDAVVYSYGKTVFVDLKEMREADILVYSISGQIVAGKKSATGIIQLNVPLPGAYTVRVLSNERSITRKLVIY